MIVLTIIGVFLGTMVLVMLPLWVLNFCLGIMVIVFVVSNLLKFDFAISPGGGKNTVADFRAAERVFKRHDQRRRTDLGDLFL